MASQDEYQQQRFFETHKQKHDKLYNSFINECVVNFVNKKYSPVYPNNIDKSFVTTAKFTFTDKKT